jgi:DNA-binding MarR family transcriptional regulator
MADMDLKEVAQCSCLRLRRITRRTTRIYDHLLEPEGLTVNQFGLLARLYGASLRGESLSIGSLAERVGMDSTTLNRSLKPLEIHGFIANGRGLTDRRVRAVLITSAGIEKFHHAVPLWRKAQAQIDAALGVDISVALNGLLELSYEKLSASRGLVA